MSSESDAAINLPRILPVSSSNLRLGPRLLALFFPQVEVTKFGIDKKNMFAFWDVSTTFTCMYLTLELPRSDC